MFNYIAAAVLLVAPALAAPSTNATCTAEAWSFNSRIQSPCLVGAYLAAQCTTDNTFRIPSLGEGNQYTFNVSQADACLCNSVMWNLISACALCQVRNPTTWQEWRAPCADSLVTIGSYPLPLPVGVAVPSWAYYDFTVANTFNGVIASQQSGLESSAVSGPTSTPTPVPSPTVSATEAVTGPGGNTSTSSPVKSQSGSSSNTGAIVGGVVGGVLGIALIGLIAFILLRKRKSEESKTNQPQPSHQRPMSSQFNAASPMTGHAASHQYGTSSPPLSTAEYKSYNPSHPSVPNTPATGQYVESLSYPYQPQGVVRQAPYPRAPEL